MQAARDPHGVFPTLAPLSDGAWRREASRRTRKASAPGIAGVTAQPAAAHRYENLHDLHERLRSGRSQAPPVERVWIETEDGKQRPIGKAPFEDTMVQRAVARRREAIDAHDVSEGSYGCRQGRSPHEARHERRERCMRDTIGWSVDAEGSGSVDRIDRTRLREGWRQRVNEGRRLRRSGQWLRAGVMEDAILRHPETGVVQGGVIAPVLAKRVLPHVLDAWCAQEVWPRMPGRWCLMRFAEDCVMGCASEGDARRIMAVRPKRCARYGLPMPPTQTTLIAFRQPAAHHGSADGSGTCDFLGLPHDWTKSRRGVWGITRRTASKRHAPLQYQYQQLCQKGRGPLQYVGMRGNLRLLEDVGRCVEKAWRSWLRRRSNERASGWAKCEQRMQTEVLPTPRIVHNS